MPNPSWSLTLRLQVFFPVSGRQDDDYIYITAYYNSRLIVVSVFISYNITILTYAQTYQHLFHQPQWLTSASPVLHLLR